MTIRTVIVDDEPLAREKIRGFLEQDSDFEIVGECADGAEAIEVFKEKKPDLAFLDIQMPEMDGFELLDQFERDELPCVVFVTAFDEYAVKAFDVHAIDYLLKPYDQERFQEAVTRVKERLGGGTSDIQSRLTELLEQLPQNKKFRDRLVVKSEGRVVFVQSEDIDWIEAAGNYARLHVNDDAHLIRETMIGLERKLDPERFVRIHRSAIVNVGRIKEMQPLFHGEYLVVLNSGTQLTLSRGYRDNLQKILGDSL